MSSSLSGVRADRKCSYRELEKVAVHAREQLRFEPEEAINPLASIRGTAMTTAKSAGRTETHWSEHCGKLTAKTSPPVVVVI
jgi:hypothetical protein